MVYRANATMEFLSKQDIDRVMNQEQYEQLQEVKDAFLKELDLKCNLNLMLTEAYTLGFIMGKRDERARKRGRK